MIDYPKSPLSLKFAIGFCRGESMSMEIWQDDIKICYIDQFPSHTYEIDIQVRFPSEIKFVVSNKDLSKDTIIDEDGNIIENKFIHLVSASVGLLPVEEIHLLNEVTIISEGSTQHKVYWDYPVTATLNLLSRSVTEWHLRHLIKK